MDQMIIAEKLESMRRCIQRIEDKTPEDAGNLIRDIDLQDILVVNLTRAVQISVDIGSHIISSANQPMPQTMGDVFTRLQELDAISQETSERLRKAVGSRNIAFHNYEAINWEIVYAICRYAAL